MAAVALTNSTNTKTASRAELEAKTMPELKLMCKAANVPVTGKKEALVGFLLDPSNNQKGKRKAGGAPGGQSKAAKAARAMAGPWSDAGDADDTDKALVDPARSEAKLRGYVNTCAFHVDANWHDCYEETGEQLQSYMKACVKRANACVRVAVEGGAAYDSCHRTLCIIKDTWDDMQCIPFRGSGSEDVANGDYDQITIGNAMFSACSPTELVDNVLPLVLAAAAADARVTDAALHRMIKDAFDHGVTAPQDPVPQEEAGEEMDESDVPADVKAGRARLAALVDDIVEWDFLFSWKPKHKMRRGIDRRFDGPKHLRTRDYDSESDNSYAGLGGWCTGDY